MEKLKCMICGLESTNLTTHIPRIHKLSNKEYKNKFNVLTTQIFSEKTKEKRNITRKKNGILSVYQIQYWVNKGMTESEAKYQISIRRPSNKNYWINKYGKEVGLQKYEDWKTNFRNTKNCWINKYGKEIGLQKYNKHKKEIITNTKLEYWINKGLTEVDFKNRQNTSSKEKMISKYGKIIGLKKYNESIKRRQNTLNSKTEEEIQKINKSKDSNSFSHFQNKMGNLWKVGFLNRNYKNETEKEIVKQILEYENLNDLKKNILKILQDPKTIYNILKAQSLQNFFGYKYSDLNTILSDIFGVKFTSNIKYGKMIKYNGITLRSMGEYFIAKYLVNHNIDFIYDKKYPNQKYFRYRFDFYIPKFDLYIEYAGLKTKNYKLRIIKKKKFCLSNNFNVFISDSVQKIKDFINEKENNNRTNI